MSQEMAMAINDGLFGYEDELWNPSDDEDWVSVLFLIFLIPYFFLFNLRVPRLRLAVVTSSPM